jgi:thymidylate synthase ThyX
MCVYIFIWNTATEILCSVNYHSWWHIVSLCLCCVALVYCCVLTELLYCPTVISLM